MSDFQINPFLYAITRDLHFQGDLHQAWDEEGHAGVFRVFNEYFHRDWERIVGAAIVMVSLLPAPEDREFLEHGAFYHPAVVRIMIEHGWLEKGFKAFWRAFSSPIPGPQDNWENTLRNAWETGQHATLWEALPECLERVSIDPEVEIVTMASYMVAYLPPPDPTADVNFLNHPAFQAEAIQEALVEAGWINAA